MRRGVRRRGRYFGQLSCAGGAARRGVTLVGFDGPRCAGSSAQECRVHRPPRSVRSLSAVRAVFVPAALGAASGGRAWPPAALAPWLVRASWHGEQLHVVLRLFGAARAEEGRLRLALELALARGLTARRVAFLPAAAVQIQPVLPCSPPPDAEGSPSSFASSLHSASWRGKSRTPRRQTSVPSSPAGGSWRHCRGVGQPYHRRCPNRRLRSFTRRLNGATLTDVRLASGRR